MKRRILLGILAIASISGLVGAFTYAWFSDVETTNARLEAGIMDLVLDPGEAFSLVIRDLKPCVPRYASVRLSLGQDSNPGPVYFQITNVRGENGEQSDAEVEADPTGNVNDIYNWITFDLCIDRDQDEECDPDEVIFHPDDHMTLGQLDSVWVYLDWLTQQTPAMELILSFHLQAEAGNEYQGDIAHADFEFMLQQGAAPPPSTRIILENKDENWDPILGDGIWGIAEYMVGDLALEVLAKGLPANEDVQISINSPEKATWFPVDDSSRRAMASALASHVYDGDIANMGTAPPSGYNLYERGYYDTVAGGNLKSTWNDDDDIGVFTTSKYGIGTGTYATDGGGYLDAYVGLPLPSGTYSYIKVVVKEDGNDYTPYLMEKDTTLFFVIP